MKGVFICHKLVIRRVKILNFQIVSFQWKYPLWYSKNINAKGDYFAMNSKNMKINDFNLIEEYVR